VSGLGRLVRTGEVVAYGVLALLGAAAVVTAFGYGVLVEGGRVGPGFVPLLAGASLAGLCGAVFVRKAREACASDTLAEAPPTDVDIFGRTASTRVRILWTVFGLTLLTLLLVPYLGFLASFGLLVLAVSTLVERRRPVPSLAIAVCAVAVAHAVFGLFLHVPLPGGLLGIGGGG
jgi:putative tricarboxylic transport membrane protein